VTFRHILARRQHYGVIFVVGDCVDNLPRRVYKVESIPGVAQSVAYAAIGHKDYVAAEVGEVGVEVGSGSDYNKTTRRQSQGGEGVSLMIVADFPSIQVDSLPRAV
jgi:hypothetical protein